MVTVCEEGRRLQPLHKTDYRALHTLMKERKFPAVPPTLREAEDRFASARLLGLVEPDGTLAAGFVFGPPEEGVAFFDVVCSAALQGKWATPRVLKALFSYAFGTLGLRAVWVQSEKGRPLRAALGAGFVPVTPLTGKAPILVITPPLVPKRLREGA